MASARSVEEDLEYAAALASVRAPWESHWQALAEYVQPRKASMNTNQVLHGPNVGAHEKLYDTTGVDANQILARGQLAWMTPKESPWFEFLPDDEFEGDEKIANWYSEATLAIRRMLANSNFYTEIHENYLDRGGFGTAGLFCDWDEEVDGYHFDVLPLGQYSVAENFRGYVDTLYMEYKWTIRQAAQKFGEAMLPADLAKKLADPKEREKQQTFVHCVYPRTLTHRDPQSPFAKDLPIVSRWIHKESKELILEGGFSSNPFFVTRFLRWRGVATAVAPWGWCPTWAALGDLRQLNHLEMLMDELAERKVRPPLLIPDYLEERMDLRPGGQSVFDADKGAAGLPQEWISKGEYNVGEARAGQKRERVNRAFMVQLFELLASIEKQMTLGEVQARLQEKVDQFSPTFDLITSEQLGPCLKRGFQLALMHGKLPEIPRRLVAPDPVTGELSIPEPRINYTSRLAMAISAASDQGVLRTVSFAGEMAPLRPDILDNFDFDNFIRTYYRHNGGDPDILVPKELMEARRMQRAQGQQQAAEMEMMAKAGGRGMLAMAGKE